MPIIKKETEAEVAPLVGAWIEIMIKIMVFGVDLVAPLVGAWIEITIDRKVRCIEYDVAPLVGAWIEICQ